MKLQLKRCQLSPKTGSDIEVEDEEGIKGVEPVKVQLVGMQPTKNGIEAARQKDL